MSRKDLFDKPFDEGTMVKLEIFEKYLEVWLPTFVMSDFPNPIQIFDLFSGSGRDMNGISGSPLRIIEIIKKHINILKKQQKIVYLFFNDIDRQKITLLEKLINDSIADAGLSSFIVVQYTNETFIRCLDLYRKCLNNGCNLIFVDQNGFKEVNEKVFKFLIGLQRTDFMFFISSTFIHRFANRPEFANHHPNFDINRIRKTSRKLIHNVICDEFEKYVPPEIKSYALFSFSIMKSDHNNIYGLIFVTKHILGADKFLQTVWKKNAINGNANYDIDDDLSKDQLDLFNGKLLTKIEKFQLELRNKILDSKISNNKEAYLFTINNGHISSHADDKIRKMKREKLIDFESKSSLVNYDQVCKKKRTLNFKLIKQ